MNEVKHHPRTLLSSREHFKVVSIWLIFFVYDTVATWHANNRQFHPFPLFLVILNISGFLWYSTLKKWRSWLNRYVYRIAKRSSNSIKPIDRIVGSWLVKIIRQKVATLITPDSAETIRQSSGLLRVVQVCLLSFTVNVYLYSSVETIS